MTDNEIIKVLEYCTTDGWCQNCPHEKKCIEDEITQLALDLINRQKAEIERLNRNIELLAICKKDLPEKTAKVIKAEAVKEFADRLKENMSDDWSMFSDDGYTLQVDYGKLIELIDNLVKEMAGEADV